MPSKDKVYDKKPAIAIGILPREKPMGAGDDDAEGDMVRSESDVADDPGMEAVHKLGKHIGMEPAELHDALSAIIDSHMAKRDSEDHSPEPDGDDIGEGEASGD